MQQLTVPKEVEQDPSAIEMLRAWTLPNDDIGFVTKGFPVDDPALLGIFFADLARHYFEIAGMEKSSWPRALRRVADALIAEARVSE